MTTDAEFLDALIKSKAEEREAFQKRLGKCDMCPRIGRTVDGLCQVCQQRYKDDIKVEA
jgi:hypothetical protein